LLAIDEVPVDIIQDLAAFLRAEYNLQVAVLPRLSLAGRERQPGHLVDQGRGQVNGDALLQLLRELFPPIAATDDTSLIAVTSYDMYNSTSPNLRYVFALGETRRGGTAAVSYARLHQMPTGEDDEAMVTPRLRKAVLRRLGTIHFGLPMSEDPSSIMWEGFLNSPWALDELSDHLKLD
jgi:predicted Zn-dependent protease